MAGSAAASCSAQARLGSSHGAGWATCWLQLRARPLTQSQAIPLVLLAPDVYVPLDPLWSQDAHLLWVQTVWDKDPMNRSANAHFVVVSKLLFTLHKGSCQYQKRNVLSVLNIVTVQMHFLCVMFENGAKWKSFEPPSVLCLALDLICAMHQHSSACLSLSNAHSAPCLQPTLIELS